MMKPPGRFARAAALLLGFGLCWTSASRGDDVPKPSTPPVPKKQLPVAEGPTMPVPAGGVEMPAPAPTAPAPTPEPMPEVAPPPAPAPVPSTPKVDTAPVPPPAPVPAPVVPGSPKGDELELVFAYGSEKKSWIEEATRLFSATEAGRGVRVRLVAAGSGEIIEDVLSGKLQAHVVSPASAAFVVIGNGRSRESGAGDLVGATRPLVSSPIVLAIWSDRAEAAGWTSRPVSWVQVFEAARDPKKWADLTASKPVAGRFLLGHTDPENSNSGLHALILMAYGASGKFDGSLSRTDLTRPEFAAYLSGLEASVVQPLDSSTGFLAKSMLKKGPSGMTAAILYENLVIESNKSLAASGQPSRIVAIYPTEGTFPSEHPVGLVERPWVTAPHRRAAEAYIAFLLEKPQQEKAKAYGFRPSDPSLPLDDLLKPEFGVSAAASKVLPTPSASALTTLRAQWRQALATPPIGR